MQISVWDHARYVCDRQHPFPEMAAQMHLLAEAGVRKCNIYLPTVGNLDAYLRAAAEVSMAVEARIHPQEAIDHPVLRTMPETRWQEMEARHGIRLAAPCPNHPSFAPGLAAAVARVAEGYADRLCGVQLDFIRSANSLLSLDYPCECDGCRALRRKYFGYEVPTEAQRGEPACRYKELAWLNANVRAAVVAVREVTAQYGLELSIAARSNYLNSLDIPVPPVWGLGPAVTEGQDWVEWAKAGLMDAVVTMNYHTRREYFRQNLEDHLRLLQDSRVRFCSGIGLSSSMGELSPGQLRERLQLLREKGVTAAYIFNKTNIYSPECLAVLREFAS
jgi:uncharacterized lipoprotein YddW (UPF0748 family)